MDLLSLLPQLINLYGAGKGVQAAQKGVNLGPNAQTVSNMQQIGAAETNQNNPLFQSMLQANKQTGDTQLGRTISQLQGQNRLAQSMGQNPLLSQERGGESIFRNLMQGQEDVANQAVGQTYGQLGQAMQGQQGIGNAQAGLANAQFKNTTGQVGSYGTLSDALSGMFGLKKPQAGTTSAMTGQPTYGQQNQTPLGGGMQNYGLPQYMTGSAATGGY